MKNLFFVISLLFLVLGLNSSHMVDEKKSFNENQIVIKEDEEDANREVEEQATVSNETEGSKGFFWKVTNNGNTVYLLGSIHVATREFYPLHQEIESAFEESKYLVVEADIVNNDQFKLQKYLRIKASYPDGSKLEDHLTPELYRELENAFKQYGIKIEMFENYELWYINMLLESLNILKLGYNPELGIDYYFLKKAKDSKEIIELEGAVYQLELFDRFSEEIQLKLLEEYMKQKDQYEDEMRKLSKIWIIGDKEALVSLLTETEDESEELKEYNRILLDERNVLMANKVEKFLNSETQGTYFLIVGAAHFFGEQGIIHLLNEKGFTIKSIFE